MVEYAPSNEPEAGKRRSTRIVQAIPVTVAGVDALGQPFRERTSTLIVNCHGFKYQSKHYVLKGTSLELEVLHPEADKPARKVRGQVTFVQRPRTAKELFQVGVEMDTPGNVWGIAFPPDDWIPFPEEGEEAAARPPAKAAPVVSAPAMVSAPPVTHEKALRSVPPVAAADLSGSVSQQITRMLADAQEQIQRVAREAGAEAISREAASLLRDLNIQLKTAAEKAMEQASTGYADQVVRKALKKIEEARETSAQEMRATLAREFENDLRGLSQGVLAKLTEAGETFRKDFSQQITADVTAANSRLGEIENRVKAIQEQMAANTATIPALLENAQKEIGAFAELAKQKWGEQLESRAEEGLSRLAKLEEAAVKLHEEIQSASDSAQAGWQQKLEKDMAEAKARLEKAVTSTYAGAEKHLAEQVARMAAEAAARVTTALDKRTTDLRSVVDSAMTEAERRVTSLRASLEEGLAKGAACASEMQAISAQVESHSKQIEELARKAGDEVVRQFEDMLAANREQLNVQADSVLAGLAQRLEPALAERGVEMVTRVAADVEKKVSSHLHRADGTMKKLSELEAVAAETLRQEQARLQSEFEKASQKVLAHCLEELDAKSTNATHETFEQLYKSAEWYQHKAQTSMQTAFEKGITQSTTQLREKAAEISTLFASELDHYSRSYSEHTQGLLEEAAKEMASRIRAQVVETTEAGAATFSDEIHHLAENKVERLKATSGSVVEEARARLAVQVENVCGELDKRAAQTASEFQTRVAERLRQSVNEAKQEFQTQLVPVLDNWRAEARAHQEQWLQSLGRKENESVEQFKLRLENVSNSWMVAAVTTLSQHSQGVLDSLARAVEQRLRDTCAEVFAGVGESMRQRLLGISTDLKKGSGE
ncbi:MAG: hypothetical protein HY012_07505 [Acidobacteria bacterium]|nr:hypothetical protein [Acidobacteriota bacterium]